MTKEIDENFVGDLKILKNAEMNPFPDFRKMLLKSMYGIQQDNQVVYCFTWQ